jgi:prepilin-type N-terminal cleavage/methylation domain-containing protein
MNLQKKEKGFTIIEVVLVLAIAGLIFLMVFIALPALQRNQRDTARKADVGAVASAVVSYTGNNRGVFPTSLSLGTYVTEKSQNTTDVKVGESTATSITDPDGIVVVTEKTTCGESTATGQVLAPTTNRKFTVVTKLESGGGAYYCQDN